MTVNKRPTVKVDETSAEKTRNHNENEGRQSRSKSRNVVMNSLSGPNFSSANSDKKRVISAIPNPSQSGANNSYTNSTSTNFSKNKGPAPPKVGITKRKTPAQAGAGLSSRNGNPSQQGSFL